MYTPQTQKLLFIIQLLIMKGFIFSYSRSRCIIQSSKLATQSMEVSHRGSRSWCLEMWHDAILQRSKIIFRFDLAFSRFAQDRNQRIFSQRAARIPAKGLLKAWIRRYGLILTTLKILICVWINSPLLLYPPFLAVKRKAMLSDGLNWGDYLSPEQVH